MASAIVVGGDQLNTTCTNSSAGASIGVYVVPSLHGGPRKAQDHALQGEPIFARLMFGFCALSETSSALWVLFFMSREHPGTLNKVPFYDVGYRTDKVGHRVHSPRDSSTILGTKDKSAECVTGDMNRL